MNTLKFMFSIDTSTRTNYLLYLLTKLPIIKNHLPTNLYLYGVLKKLATVLSVILGIVINFITKAIYVGVIVIVCKLYLKLEINNHVFSHIIFLLGFLGLLNILINNADKNYYYAIDLLRVNAKKYILTDLIYNLIVFYISYIPTMLVCSVLFGISPIMALALPLESVAAKIIFTSIMLAYYKKYDEILTTKKFFIFTYVGIIFIIVIISCARQYFIESEIIYITICILTLISILSIFYIVKFDQYKFYYKKLYSNINFDFSSNIKAVNIAATEKGLKYTNSEYNNLSGFKYLDKIFFERYKKILIRPYIIKSAIISVAITIILIILIYNKVTIKYEDLAYILCTITLYTYLLDNSKNIINQYFMGCDRFLFQYPFFKDGNSILTLFRIRLRSTLLYSMAVPVIASITFIIYFLFLDIPLDKRILYASLIVIYTLVFGFLLTFHNLFMYYMFQPYTEDTNKKGIPYFVTNIIIYLIIISLGYIHPSLYLILITIGIIFFIYLPVGYYLIKKYAPERFRLRN